MSAYFRLVCLISFITLLILYQVGLSNAQNNDSSRQIISVDNVDQLTQIASLGVDGQDSFTFSPNGTWLVVFKSKDFDRDVSTVDIYNLLEDPQLSTPNTFEFSAPFNPPSFNSASVFFSEDERWLTLSSIPSSIYVYDLENAEIIVKQELQGSDMIVRGNSTYMLRTGTPFSTGTTGFQVFDLLSDTASPLFMEGFTVLPHTFSSNGQLFVAETKCEDCFYSEFRVFDLETGNELLSIPPNRSSDVPPSEWTYMNDVQISPDGKFIAYGTSQYMLPNFSTFGSGTVHLVDIETNDERLRIDEETAVLGNMFFSSDGKLLAYNTINWMQDSPDFAGSQVHVLEIDTGSSKVVEGFGLATQFSPDFSQVFTVAQVFARDINEEPLQVASLTDDWKILDVESEQIIVRGFSKFEYNPSSSLIVAARSEAPDVMIVYDSDSGDEIITLEFDGEITALKFSPDGTLLVVQYVIDGENFAVLWGVP